MTYDGDKVIANYYDKVMFASYCDEPGVLFWRGIYQTYFSISSQRGWITSQLLSADNLQEKDFNTYHVIRTHPPLITYPYNQAPNNMITLITQALSIVTVLSSCQRSSESSRGQC